MFLNQRCILLAAVAIVVVAGCAEKQPQTPLEILNHSFSTGDWNTTITLCEQMLAERPDDIELLKKLGQAHLATEKYTEAVADYTKLIELLPEEPDPYYGRESAHKGLGNEELAYEDGQAARKLDPLYKSAYAYDMSNFVPQVDLSSEPPPEDLASDSNDDQSDESDDSNDHEQDDAFAENSNDTLAENESNDPNRTPYEETVFSDEAGFEPNETSRVLAKDAPDSEAPKADAGDIGIPKVPEIVMENNLPKLNMNGAGPIAPDADGSLARLEDIRFPADPTEDANDELDELADKVIRQQLTTSLPTDELGNFRFPSTPTDRFSTGLQNNVGTVEGQPLRSPSGVAITNSGPIATGINAPTPNGAAVNPIAPSPGFVDPKFNNNLPGVNGINGLPPAQIGLSGLPLPNGSTGLPTGPSVNGPIGTGQIGTGQIGTGQITTGPTTINPSTVGPGLNPSARTGFAPNGTQFPGNPIFGPGSQAVISTSLPGYSAPNASPPPAAPTTTKPQISTSLSDTVLQNRLQNNNTQPTLKLRSIQP